MTINIDRLTRDELVDLNRRIVERLKFMDSLAAHRDMMRLEVGARVRFAAPGRGELEGVLVKYNRKTVTVIVGSERWNISPQLLRPAEKDAEEIDLVADNGEWKERGRGTR